MNWTTGLAELFTGVIRLVLAWLVAIFGFGLVAGCQPNTEPIERKADMLLQQVVAPAIEKALTELGTTSAQLQGQGSLIEPGYKISGYGFFGTGIVYDAEIKAVGVSANIAGATQMDDDGPPPQDAVIEPVAEPTGGPS